MARPGSCVVTGYVFTYAPGFDGRSHRVTVRGRWRTAGLVDSAVDFDGGQLNSLRHRSNCRGEG
jgi:hypothetical protein